MIEKFLNCSISGQFPWCQRHWEVILKLKKIQQ